MALSFGMMATACAPQTETPAEEPASEEPAAEEPAASEAPAATPEESGEAEAPSGDTAGLTIGYILSGPDIYYEQSYRVFKALADTAGWDVTKTASDYDPKKETNNVQGSIGSDANSSQAGMIVAKIAEFFSADGYLLPSPLVLDTEETTRRLKEDTHIKYIMEHAKNARACVFAIGVASHDSVLLKHGAYSKEMYEEILRRGAVGDVLGYCFDIQGRQVAPGIDKSIMSMSLSDLKKIELRIGIAVGEHKIKAIIGALRGGYINVLYTDSLTVRQVVNIMNLS
jgi:DNA-binding transcriptional regulator LsrR (DeoR family)